MDRRTCLLAIAGLPLAGCDLGTATRLLRDPKSAAEAKVAAYISQPDQLITDLKFIKQQLDKLKGFARDIWGREDAETPGAKRYVKYTEAFRNRVIVDFQQNTLTVETIDGRDPWGSLEQALIIALLTPDDPESVDLFSAKPVALGGRPYLYELILDDQGRPITNRKQATGFARDRVVRLIKERRLANGKKVYFLSLPLERRTPVIQARKFEDPVTRNSRRFGIEAALILAVIEVESAFNPFAVSSAPAFGLMQLVPSTGGRDAMRFVYKQDRDPTPNELFRKDFNIELGTAYLHMLDRRYLKDIRDPLTRIYAVIAAYNGGAGNVFRIFGGNPKKSMASINRLSPAELYSTITQRHSSAETRRYLEKVVKAWRRYQRST